MKRHLLPSKSAHSSVVCSANTRHLRIDGGHLINILREIRVRVAAVCVCLISGVCALITGTHSPYTLEDCIGGFGSLERTTPTIKYHKIKCRRLAARSSRCSAFYFFSSWLSTLPRQFSNFSLKYSGHKFIYNIFKCTRRKRQDRKVSGRAGGMQRNREALKKGQRIVREWHTAHETDGGGRSRNVAKI